MWASNVINNYDCSLFAYQYDDASGTTSIFKHSCPIATPVQHLSYHNSKAYLFHSFFIITVGLKDQKFNPRSHSLFLIKQN